MNLADILTLAKQGYKPGDIKELISMAETVEAKPEPEKEPEIKEDPKEPEKAVEDPATEPKESPQPEESAKIKELEDKIKELQQANISKDISKQQEDPEEILKDLVTSFM